MSFGVFVQLNEGSLRGKAYPLGYVIEENGCWQWVGNIARGGYGSWRIGHHRFAHRAMYERHKGPIPEGLVIDHLCRNTGCVNPDHLEAVTEKENILRGTSPTVRCAKATACPHGHPYDDWNTQIYDGRRACRMCKSVRNARRYTNLKARKALGGSK